MKTVELSWKEFNVNLEMVQAHMKSLDSSCCGMSGNSKLEVHFTNDDLSQEVIDEINTYWDGLSESSPEVSGYATMQQMKTIKANVAKAKSFADDLLVQFAAENIQLGINADDKVDDVLDVMAPVLVALQSASLTSAIKRAKAIPSASYDSKYVTAARLLQYVNKIETFLGLPHSESL